MPCASSTIAGSKPAVRCPCSRFPSAEEASSGPGTSFTVPSGASTSSRSVREANVAVSAMTRSPDPAHGASRTGLVVVRPRTSPAPRRPPASTPPPPGPGATTRRAWAACTSRSGAGTVTRITAACGLLQRARGGVIALPDAVADTIVPRAPCAGADGLAGVPLPFERPPSGRAGALRRHPVQRGGRRGTSRVRADDLARALATGASAGPRAARRLPASASMRVVAAGHSSKVMTMTKAMAAPMRQKSTPISSSHHSGAPTANPTEM